MRDTNGPFPSLICLCHCLYTEAMVSHNRIDKSEGQVLLSLDRSDTCWLGSVADLVLEVVFQEKGAHRLSGFEPIQESILLEECPQRIAGVLSMGRRRRRELVSSCHLLSLLRLPSFLPYSVSPHTHNLSALSRLVVRLNASVRRLSTFSFFNSGQLQSCLTWLSGG